MKARDLLLVGCALLLGLHLVAYRLVQDGSDVLGGIAFVAAWSLFMWIGVRANRVRVKKPRKAKKPAPVPATEPSVPTSDEG